MHYKDLVRHWHEGIISAEEKDYDLAFKSFTCIEDPPAKIWFNVGRIYLLRGDLLQALEVISSIVPNDQYSGFEPLRPQQPGFYEPCRDTMQSREAGYHRVVVHYYPENSNEVNAVKANSVLFKILIPTSFLEPTNPPKADIKKMNNGIPLPPMKTPPRRPNVKPGVEQFTLTQQGNPVPPPVPDLTSLPPQPTGDTPEPYKQKLVPMRMEPIVEVALPLQRSAPIRKEMAELNIGPKMMPPVEEDKQVHFKYEPKQGHDLPGASGGAEGQAQETWGTNGQSLVCSNSFIMFTTGIQRAKDSPW
ncbi:hypothetical protein XELAEV_18041462mg [Xenopus laevis]|uniref:Uncharacterized protein n=1 Tax=Xenopus laevis TaxID=8355 RepID=A0A974H531_XENLA|nr:hypothetical protein XELAEV_18041462mg [Xenopus laevis]